MSLKDKHTVNSIYSYLIKHNPERLDFLANVYSKKSGISRNFVDGLDAIIYMVLSHQYSTQSIIGITE